MIPRTLANPFIKQQVGHELVPPPGNVPDLHKDVHDQCRRLIQQVRATRYGTSLLVRGEAGSGKSHLITQLRADLADDPGAFVIRIPMHKAYIGQVWRYIRKQFVEELLRKNWCPQHPSLTGFVRIVQNAFPGWSPAGRRGVMGIIGNRSASQDLQEQLELFAGQNEFPYEVRQVLPRLWNSSTATLAADWLRGKSLADEDLGKLGLPASYPNDFEQEQTARDVVTSLCRLAAEKTTLLICFDEIEALLSGDNDTVALRAFTNLATDLIADPGPRLVVTFVRSTTEVALQKHVEHSNVQKMGQSRSAIPPLQWEQVVQLVLARLHADAGCREERLRHSQNQFWPFSEDFLRDLYDRERRDLTPRHVLIACNLEFERLQRGVADKAVLTRATPTDPTEAERVPPRESAEQASAPSSNKEQQPLSPNSKTPERLQDLWDKRRARHLSHLHALSFETVLGNGLRWLARVMDLPFEMSDTKDSRLGDVSLVFRDRDAGKFVGVSFCHHDPHVLWRRLDRLINQSQAAKAHGLLGRLVVVRSTEPKPSDAARERLEKLRRGGAFVHLLPKEQLAELAAFQELQSKSQTGGITDFGKPITGEQFDQWARANLSSSMKELADVIFGIGTRSTNETGKDTPLPAEPVKSQPRQHALFASEEVGGKAGRKSAQRRK